MEKTGSGCSVRPVLAVVGPTASGKTGYAVAVARMGDGEIISGDSRQVYRGMDIGTGKDLGEYGDVRCHLLDVADAGEKYNLFQYLRDAELAVEDVSRRGKLPVLCGGSGLYVESFLKGLRLPPVPENTALRASLAGKSLDELAGILARMKRLHNTTDIDSCQRAIRAIEIEEYYLAHPEEAREAREAVPRRSTIIGVDVDREVRRERISRRLDSRLDEGMVDEVRRLIEGGVAPEDLIYYGLEYKFVTEYVIGKTSFDQMRKLLEIAIHQFAKRQMTWFRGAERRGLRIHWLPGKLSREEFAEQALELYHREHGV
ncbi:MAG: tRNA (adenosine(37)-N6)-dimethylallyltransferase MiaA [Muribaculaceae bacterium]|nr:tRNA (adenosine(37)-N6)-dimethylallyltransferase MiaA [Muribaculaceae bacterium]